MRLGDSLREAIERGLATARFGVVILSPSFFAKEWPQRELNALLARETTKRSKVLLPVWHNLTVAEIVAHSPILADRLAVSTIKGMPNVVEQILQVLGYEKARGGPAVPHPLRPPEPAATRLPFPGEERIHEKDGSVLVYVPGGDYILGGDGNNLIHRVVLSPFWIGKYEVTNEQYARFRNAVPGAARPKYWKDNRFNQPRQPVVGVSWEEARTYCLWAGLALPSEAQWEAAARGKDSRHYQWGNEAPTPEHANFGENKSQPTEVGSFPRGGGPFGTLDQAGNVWEWCEDLWHHLAYEARAGVKDPVNYRVYSTTMRCVRGGSWRAEASRLVAANRCWFEASDRSEHVGFRCLLPAPSLDS